MDALLNDCTFAPLIYICKRTPPPKKKHVKIEIHIKCFHLRWNNGQSAFSHTPPLCTSF